jgi:hypothetical protein
MSQRPRLAGDGRLTLPSKVAFDRQGFIRGRFSDTTVDPFDWTMERLLLAESLARLDLADRRATKAWWVANGALDPWDFTGGDASVPDDGEWVEHRPAGAFAESREEAAQEQANVRWHLATLVHLSEHRDDTTWDATWGELVLDGPGKTYLVGGRHAGVEVWSPYKLELVRQHPESESYFGSLDEQIALQPEVARRPTVTVRASGWYGSWGDVTANGPEIGLEGGAEAFRVLGSTWDSVLDLERRLMEPYVAHAVERRFSIDLQSGPADGRKVLVARETRQWLSALAPIYLQLFEALRRISEGEPGAAVCRECGQPFLVLDARRRFFCNDRERYRFSQRDRRRRLSEAAHDPEIDAEFERIEQELEEEARSDRAIKADLASPEPWLPEKVAKTLQRRKKYR